MKFSRETSSALILFGVLFGGAALAQPIPLTGNVNTDFDPAAHPGVTVVNDPGGIDVGIPTAPPNCGFLPGQAHYGVIVGNNAATGLTAPFQYPGFYVAEFPFPGIPVSPGTQFAPTELPGGHTGTLFFDPSSAHPHLEFSINCFMGTGPLCMGHS